jgi:O-6-methylguanine DNA methyltransferase
MSENNGVVYKEEWIAPLGKITVCCSEKGVRQLTLSPSDVRSNRKDRPASSRRAAGSDGNGVTVASKAITELREYARGDRTKFTVPLDLQGTPFQLKVWKALLRIPYGETRSYKDIAQSVGNGRASRAVGMANHWNPIAIIVPCHRVISSDGSLGGYAGGLRKKVQILRLEKTHSA